MNARKVISIILLTLELITLPVFFYKYYFERKWVFHFETMSFFKNTIRNNISLRQNISEEDFTIAKNEFHSRFPDSIFIIININGTIIYPQYMMAENFFSTSGHLLKPIKGGFDGAGILLEKSNEKYWVYWTKIGFNNEIALLCVPNTIFTNTVTIRIALILLSIIMINIFILYVICCSHVLFKSNRRFRR